jgi:hypothetical protein
VRRGILALLALLAFVAAVPAHALDGNTYGPDVVRVWHLRRVDAAAPSLQFTVLLQPRDQRSTLVVASAGQGRGRWQPDAGGSWFADWRSGSYPVVYGGDLVPVSSPSCPDPLLCTQRDDGSWVDGGSYRIDRRLDVFVATVNMPVQVRVETSGWAKRELRPGADGPNLRVFTARDGGGTGAQAGQSVEYFRGVQAAGGRHGSTAWAALPCDSSWTYAPTPEERATGVGAAVFRGGRSEHYLACGNSTSGWDRTDRRTTWAVVGEAAGTSVSANRLTVFDFPRP